MTDEQAREWTRAYARRFAGEMREIVDATLEYVDLGFDPRYRLIVRSRTAQEPDWHVLAGAGLAVLAGVVSKSLGRRVGPRQLRRHLEHFVAASTNEYFDLKQFFEGTEK